MSKFISLFSGSRGNASVVSFGSSSILIDAGMSCKMLMNSLSEHNISKNSIHSILITHTHTDHISALRVFCKQVPVKVYGTAQTMDTLLQNQHITEASFGGVIDENSCPIDGFNVTAFPTSHDAAGSCGFRITTPDERSCAVCTDLGVFSDTVYSAVAGSDLVLLEANYDPVMLRNGGYAAYVKSRIKGCEGHLSNEDSAEAAIKLIEKGTTRLVLGHISQNNNTPFLAEKTVRERLDTKYLCGRDYLLYIAEKQGLKEEVIF